MNTIYDKTMSKDFGMGDQVKRKKARGQVWGEMMEERVSVYRAFRALH